MTTSGSSVTENVSLLISSFAEVLGWQDTSRIKIPKMKKWRMFMLSGS
jgi:hypothetical protein